VSTAIADHHQLDVTAFGVRLRVLVEVPGLLAAVEAALPPCAVPADGEEIAVRFAVRPEQEDLCQLSREGTQLGQATEPDVAVRLLEEHLASTLAGSAKDRAFIRAGVVMAAGRAIVLPGPSLSGRTTLVDALVRAGAERYSDTFAVLDEDGWVHPYRALASGEPPPQPLRIGLIATAPYVPGASWAPERRGRADGVLALLSHAASAAEPEQVLKMLAAASSEAEVLLGDRGEAADAAPALLGSLAG
jgi:hypothetical protein